jgi:hypothetical protein
MVLVGIIIEDRGDMSQEQGRNDYKSPALFGSDTRI